jgi:hypothetical protein
MLTEKIEIKSEHTYEEVIAILHDTISESLQLFHDTIMHGSFKGNKFEAVINPPIGFVDPFKSIIKGTIITDNNKTEINILIKPSSVLFGFSVIWFVLLIFMVISFKYTDIVTSVLFIGLIMLFALIVIGLIKVKVHWDTKRLKTALNKRL